MVVLDGSATIFSQITNFVSAIAVVETPQYGIESILSLVRIVFEVDKAVWVFSDFQKVLVVLAASIGSCGTGLEDEDRNDGDQC